MGEENIIYGEVESVIDASNEADEKFSFKIQVDELLDDEFVV